MPDEQGAYFDHIAEDYAEARRRYIANHQDEIGQFIDAQIPRGAARLLDAGCGSGEDLSRLAVRSWDRLAGIDESREMIKLASATMDPDVELTVGDLQALPYCNDTFDVITSRFALHYLHDTNDAYNEFARCLRTSGTLIMVIPHPVLFESAERVGGSAAEIISVPLFDGRMIVNYPYRPLEHHLSRTFFTHFRLIAVREFLDEADGVSPGALGLAAVLESRT